MSSIHVQVVFKVKRVVAVQRGDLLVADILFVILELQNLAESGARVTFVPRSEQELLPDLLAAAPLANGHDAPETTVN